MSPQLMAHRGNSGLAPENTLAAFAKAVESGADWTELDVRLSADGEVVVMHDATVDRTTNGTGAVAELTLAELKKLDAGSWFGPDFSGERVPTLAEVIELVGRRIRLNVEIKSANNPLTVGKVIEALSAAGLLEQSMVCSFALEALLEARQLWPGGRIALISGRGQDLEIALRHGLPWFNVEYHAVDEALVRQAHEAGVKVSIWTMDEPQLWDYYAALGVDIICTSVPHLMPV
ncbi:MAG: glycerophosphodiester phosphodiesterase family protein [Armatimonadetes bacterium]|nr:glycerophosphodiester phosphodiesterase family protein [Armatimonadota bacterium]